jgi:primary-amine oxidase
MMQRRLILILIVVFGFSCGASAQQDATEGDPSVIVASHPLDALTSDEVSSVARLLVAAGHADDKTLFAAITLLEPAKASVLAWAPGQPFDRRAFVVLRRDGKTFEARVDVTSGKVLDFAEVPGAQPMIMDQEWARARDAFEADPRFAAALKRRGIAPGSSVFCTPNSAGAFPGEVGEGQRILKVPCFSNVDKLHPTLARPIEGLMGIVDSESGEVLDVIDNQIVPLPPLPTGYGGALPQPTENARPLDMIAPKGPNIKLSGNLNVGWLNWSFHVRADKRAGLVLSLVRFNDGKAQRNLAYQMAVSEMFVPYMDPDQTWGYRTFMDAGEFGLGYLISALAPGVDCPLGAFFSDLTFPNDIGGTFTRPRALCIFERPTGDPAWRHYSPGRKEVEGEPQYELVVRHIPTLGNYDYVVDYVFTPQGNMRVRVGATGFDAIKSVAAKDMEAPTAADDTAHGNLIAPYTVAPFHDHYFNFRLDLDADGPANEFVRDSFLSMNVDTPTRKNIWRLQTQRYTHEGPIMRDHGAAGGTLYRLVNPGTTNALKQHPSLWLNMHHDAESILTNDDPAQARAQFSAHTLWVTRQKPDELWAAGLYPNQSKTDTGLPVFVGDGEGILNEDLVVWYTMGFRHVTRPEDFPILPTFWHELTIRPAFFFDMDPGVTFNSGVQDLEDEQ